MLGGEVTCEEQWCHFKKLLVFVFFFFLTGKEEFHGELSIPEGKCSSLKCLTGDINTVCLL